jgi:DtxR family Mn-dependent transcriptional regulator
VAARDGATRVGPPRRAAGRATLKTTVTERTRGLGQGDDLARDAFDDAGEAGQPRITPAISAYLRAVYLLGEEGGAVTTQRVAAELGVAGPSVTNMAKRLNGLGLLRHTPYQGVELTEAGERVAVQVTRRHRLLELYLVEALGYRWDEVHAEADRLAHDVSDELAARIEAALGHPTRDPHGDPIPSRNGTIAAVPGLRLLDLEPGTAADVRRVSDRDPERLRYLGEIGLSPGTAVEVLEVLPFDGPMRIRVEGNERIVSRRLAAIVSVSPRTDLGAADRET